MYIYPIIYLCILLSSWIDFAKKPNRIVYVYFIGIFLLFFAGFRGNAGIDSPNYIYYFNDRTDTIWDWRNLKHGYSEPGFYYLSVILKSVNNDINFYFLFISLISMIPLIRSLSALSLYPILGFIVYFARFFPARNMNQIRAALAIAIVMYALKYLIENKPRVYTLLTLLAMTFHLSAIIAIIFIFIYKIKISLKMAVFFLFLSAVVGVSAQAIVPILLRFRASNLAVLGLGYLTYGNIGMNNPVIYYQIFLCLLFFYFEKRLSSIQKGYYIIRNAYLFSTIILLLTANMGVIGGRLATLFATCEIFIVPALVFTIRPRIIGYVAMILLLSIIFYFNFDKMLLEYRGWEYKINW